MKYERPLNPIATAPTDGTVIRLFGAKGTVMGRYLNCQWCAAPRPYRITPQPTRWLPADVQRQPKRKAQEVAA